MGSPGLARWVTAAWVPARRRGSTLRVFNTQQVVGLTEISEAEQECITGKQLALPRRFEKVATSLLSQLIEWFAEDPS